MAVHAPYPALIHLRFARFLKTTQQLIPAIHCGIQRLLWGFLPGPDAFQLFVHDGTNLRHIAQTQAFGEG